MPKFRERLRLDKLSSAASAAIDILVNGDTEPRVKIDAGGKVTWGGGSSSGDTNLYRDEANILKTDDDLKVGGKLSVIASSGDEGGEIFLAQAATNTTLNGGITIDSYRNKIRFFEQGGSARGAYIDLTECSNGVGTNLLSGGGGATTLDGLTDVTITSASSGQVLKYNGSAWVNDTDNAGTSINYLDDVGDVSITSAAAGDLLQWNGTAWVNESAPTYVLFDTSVGSPSSTEGKLQWDSDFGTLSFGLEGNNSVQQIGINQFAYCYNADTVTLTKGTPVYIFGGQGSQVSIKRANNSGDSTSATTLGLVSESIASGASGYVCTYGVLQGIDTSAYSEGDILYLGATAGSLTTTKPSAPNHYVFVGVVIKDAVGGEIWIRPQNGYELDEIHNVSAGSPSSGDFLKYNGTLWVNDAINLGTDTVGDYVASLVAGTGVTLSNNSGEGATPTVAIGQAIASSDSPTFAGLTINGASITFEGATADAYETTVTVTDPTADRTITIPDKSGTVAIDGSVAIGVSDTAPSSPSTGQLWYESDTGATFVYTGSAWVEVGATQGPYVCTSTTRPSSPYEGQLIYETDTDKVMTYNGSSWLYMLKPQATEPGAWTTYTPTNYGITIGNGTETARYTRIGKTVHVSYRLVLGSTSSFSGAIAVGLPSTTNSAATCTVICTDSGVATYTAMGNVQPAEASVLVRPINASGTYGTWDSNLSSAFTWNTNDVLQFSITYEES